MIVQQALKIRIHDDELAQHPLWRPIVLQLANVPITIAPESAAATAAEWTNVTLRVRHSPTMFQAWAQPDNTIRVDSGLVDGLWCLAVACYSFQEQYESAFRSADPTKVPFDLDPARPAVAIAFQYLHAALNLIIDRTPVIHSNLPPLTDDLHRAAQQLTLCAAGFVLFHEFAHLTLGHLANGGTAEQTQDTRASSRQNESDGDNFALNHIFADDGAALSPAERAFRAWGVVLTTLAFAAREMARNSDAEAAPGAAVPDVTNRTHPIGYARLDRILQHTAVASSASTLETIYNAACIPLYFLAVDKQAIPSMQGLRVRSMRELYETTADQLWAQLERLPKTKPDS